jgi:hypothetical protein
MPWARGFAAILCLLAVYRVEPANPDNYSINGNSVKQKIVKDEQVVNYLISNRLNAHGY